MKKLYAVLSVLLALAFVLSACGQATPTAEVPVVEPTAVPPTEAPPPPPTEAPPAYIACQVSDTGGTDDKSFNQFAWVGMERAQAELGADIRFLESKGEADYEPNLNAFVEEGCNMIFGVGFLLDGALSKVSTANPDISFAGVDTAWNNAPNYVGSF